MTGAALALLATLLCPQRRGSASPWDFEFAPCVEEQGNPPARRPMDRPEADPRWFVYVCGELPDRRLAWCIEPALNPCFAPVPRHSEFTPHYDNPAARHWCRK